MDQDCLQQVPQPRLTHRSLSNLPEEAFREAERHLLGLPLLRYTHSDLFIGVPILMDGIYILSLTVLILGHPTSSDDLIASLCWGVMGLCFAGLAAYTTWILLQSATYAIVYAWKRCYLCADGLLIIRGNHLVFAAIRWDEIQQIYPKKEMYQIITNENVCVSIPRFGNIREMKRLGEPVCEALRRLSLEN
jgi:hypothetical protein